MLRRSSAALARCLGTLALCALAGCPKQELAALNPCTVSGVSEQISQAGLSEVDLLFVIDDSASMAAEQLKIAKELPRLVEALTSGDRFAGREAPADVPREERFFNRVKSLHLGVISTNMGGIDDPVAAEPDTCKGLGDDGKLLRSTAIAEQGVKQPDNSPVMPGATLLPSDPSCAIPAPPLYQVFDTERGDDAKQVAHTFSCVSRLGVSGCAFEQPLEAMWKALAPGDGDGEQLQFLDDTKGHGDGFNAGFLRPEAILAVIHVSDEEDCSIKPKGKKLFKLSETQFGDQSDINIRCSKYGEKEGLVWPAERYIEGLRSLKPDHPDRIVFAAIVGIPEDANGTADLAALLRRDELQFEPIVVNRRTFERPSCRREQGGIAEEAAPPRRFVKVAQGFPDSQVLWSICSDNYAPALDTLIERIAKKLTGNCLPRQLTRNAEGEVDCELYELLAEGEATCSSERGHEGKPVTHAYRDERDRFVERRACKMKQIPVSDGTPKADAQGWYYDDFAEELQTECDDGWQQRISFRFAGNEVDLPSGAAAAYACFQSVTRTEGEPVGLGAVNTECGGSGDQDDALCRARSNGDDPGGYDLTCIGRKCQIDCASTPDCPAGWVCASGDAAEGDDPKYCQQPTCPQRN